MSENSKIEWTDHTFNPWWGCVKVSPGCQHCYAETFAKRTGNSVWGKDAPRRFFGDKHWREPMKWDADAARDGVRRRVFCASMADVFEDREDLIEPRMRLFRLIDQTPNLDWLLLTKRPQRIRYVLRHELNEAAFPTNVWLGTTVEDQQRADERIPHLLAVPATVRFLSCEPLLGPVDLGWHLYPRFAADDPRHHPHRNGVEWVIAGGESGHGARPMEAEWVRDLHAQCRRAGVPFFMKQMGGARDKHADLDDLPEDLRVREFPTPERLASAT